jgi:hypothetical protein
MILNQKVKALKIYVAAVDALRKKGKGVKIGRIMKFKYFAIQKYNLQKNLLKETKILQDIITL